MPAASNHPTTIVATEWAGEEALVPHGPYRRLLASLPPDVLASLSPTQLAAIADGMQQPPSPHLLAFNVSLPMLGGRHYLTVLFGREQRDRTRLAREGKLRPLAQLLGYGLVLWIALSLLAATGLVLLYVLKCLLGIDLFPGPSALHGLIFRR
ncbi:MAG: hypothetical protein ACKVP7_06180 [Hyphomicrobiaceae bacterium]